MKILGHIQELMVTTATIEAARYPGIEWQIKISPTSDCIVVEACNGLDPPMAFAITRLEIENRTYLATFKENLIALFDLVSRGGSESIH